MSGWWSYFLSATTQAPSSVIAAIRTLPSKSRASTLFLIQNAATPNELLNIISNRLDEILRDNVCLAHVRIQASKYLLSEIYQGIQKVESLISAFRLESAELTSTSTSNRLITAIFRPSYIPRAQMLQSHVSALEHIIVAIHQFIGMHVEALDNIRLALASKDAPDLARAIVTSCRQASSFAHAVTESTHAADLHRSINDAVRTSIFAQMRYEAAHTVHATGPLGQFWTKGSTNGNSKSAYTFSSHDVSLTLQILQTEVTNLPVLRRSLRKAIDRDYGPIWDVQRRPLRYAGLTAACAVTVRTLCIHARFLGGTGALEEAASRYRHVLQSFVVNSIQTPIVRFYDNVFSAGPSSCSEESVAIAKSSLRTMIVDFTERNLSHVPGAAELAREGSMKAVMDVVAEQASNPFRNSVAGSLGHALFLQVQKLKCDVEELMLKSKQLLKAQELNLALVALVPSLLTAATLMYATSTMLFYWRSRETDVIVSVGQTARFLLGDIHCALVEIETTQQVVLDSDTDEMLRHVKSLGWLHAKIFELEQLVSNGLIRTAAKVQLRFSDDVEMLRDTFVSFENRRKHVERMMQCYSFIRDS